MSIKKIESYTKSYGVTSVAQRYCSFHAEYPDPRRGLSTLELPRRSLHILSTCTSDGCYLLIVFKLLGFHVNASPQHRLRILKPVECEQSQDMSARSCPLFGCGGSRDGDSVQNKDLTILSGYCPASTVIYLPYQALPSTVISGHQH